MLTLYEEIEEEFLLFGIQTPIHDETKFIYLLNQAFNWKLERISDLDITFHNEVFCFSSYLYEDPHNEEDYVYVIKNTSHQKIDSGQTNSLFQDVEMYRNRLLLNVKNNFQYLIKLPEDTNVSQINNLTLATDDFIYGIHPINHISKKEKKYFLL
ncbi:MAG: IPExxxVDY family protein [Weeksellaceae bacterium]